MNCNLKENAKQDQKNKPLFTLEFILFLFLFSVHFLITPSR